MKHFTFMVLLLTLDAFSAVLEAPQLMFDFQQNPSKLEWKQIETKNFEIIFPAEVEDEAQRVAHLLEKAYPYVTRSLESYPPRIPIILQNQSINSNGFVTLAPRRSEWFLTPAIDPEMSNTEWLKTLAIHEFRHVVQFHKTRQGFNRVYEILLGEIGQALGLGLTLPPWFLEGDAVGIETALTQGGRGRLPLFERDLRTLLLSEQEWNYDKAHLGSFNDYVPNHYVYGYFYTSWLRNKYGDLFLSELADESASRSWNPLSFYNAAEDLTDVEFNDLYRSIMRDLITEWKERADKIKPTPYTVKTLGRKLGWTNYLYPQMTREGRVFALKNGLSFIDHFVLLDGKEEKTLFYPGTLQNEYPYKLRNNRVAFFEWEFDPRWGYRDYARLKVYDLDQKKFTLNKGKTKGRLAVLDHQGERVLYLEWLENQKQAFVILNSQGQLISRIPHPSDEVVTSLDWLNEDEIVFVFKDHQDSMGIKKLTLLTKEVKSLAEKRPMTLGFISVYEGNIFFESPKSGIDNIWMLTTEGERQLTSALYGAYAPILFDDKLIYNDYSALGMNIVEKALAWKSEEKSEDSFYPIYQKFSQSEKGLSFESELKDQKNYQVRPYSKVKESFNLHSWVFLAPPLSPTVTIMGLSRDLLNNFTLSFGTEYNTNEQTLLGFVGAAWTHYYPVFDLRGAYGSRRQDLLVNGSESENKWEEGTLEGGVSIPWRFIQGRFIHTFTARAFSSLIKVTGKVSRDKTQLTDGVLLSPGAEISYSVFSRLARRDLTPSWGFFLDLTREEGRNISGDHQRGSLFSLSSRINVPGFFNHHSFYHEFSYERQMDQLYQYASLILYPRGTESFFLDEFIKYSGNYLMPLFYPDWNLSRYLYLKRISLNLFYDELNGRIGASSYHAASTGWETLFDMNLVRIFLPITIGVRGSYVLSGLEKGSNYELFLATVLGTF